MEPSKWRCSGSVDLLHQATIDGDPGKHRAPIIQTIGQDTSHVCNYLRSENLCSGPSRFLGFFAATPLHWCKLEENPWPSPITTTKNANVNWPKRKRKKKNSRRNKPLKRIIHLTSLPCPGGTRKSSREPTRRISTCAPTPIRHPMPVNTCCPLPSAAGAGVLADAHPGHLSCGASDHLSRQPPFLG